jgi:prepilin-type N-terminal cleavage/methylation domain-containing protein
MKTRCTTKCIKGFTLVELLVVIVMIAVLAAMLLPSLAGSHKSTRINCVNNLKQVGLAFRLWEGDNDGKFPMQVSVTNGGTMELFSSGSQFSQFAFLNFVAMSNQLSTPKILHCPADTEHIAATNFSTGFSDANISYFSAWTPWNLILKPFSPAMTILPSTENPFSPAF